MNECLGCGCYDEDFGCTMPSIDKWYACPLCAREDEIERFFEEARGMGKQEWHTVLTLNVRLGIVKNIYRKVEAKAKCMLQIFIVSAEDT